MVEFLIAAVQGLCIFGLLCGAYFSITYGGETEAAPSAEDFDPVTTHSWHVGDSGIRHARD